MSIALKYVMSYLQNQDIDELSSTLSDNCSTNVIINGVVHHHTNEDGKLTPKIQTKEDLLNHYRNIYMYELYSVKIKELHYEQSNEEHHVNVISEQARAGFPANCVTDKITFKIKDNMIISVQHNFSVTRPGWTDIELERSKTLYEELCEKYHTC
jgi:hypothetical protein